MKSLYHNARVVHNPGCEEYDVQYKEYWWSFWQHNKTFGYWTTLEGDKYKTELKDKKEKQAIEWAQALVSKAVIFTAKVYYV